MSNRYARGCTAVWTFAFLLLSVPAIAQKSTRADLEARRSQLERDIAQTRTLLSKARQGKEQSLAEVRLLTRQLSLQEQLLGALDQEVSQLEQDLASLGQLAAAMAQDIRTLQASYARLAYSSYLHERNSAAVLWILSAESFEQAYNRLQVYRQLSRQRGEQIRLIRRAQQRLVAQQQTIDSTLQQKQTLLGRKREEAERIEENRRRQQGLYRSLAQKETGYQQKLKAYETALRSVKAKISSLIAADMRASSAATEATRKGYVRISGQFERGKGKLPWPVRVTRGVVTGRFGRVKDASGGIVDNDGIYITTDAGQSVRAVYGGKVTAVQTYPALGQIVILQHGNYRTVYVNLQDVQVKPGQKVLPLQNLGTVRQNGTGTYELYFLLYRDQEAINPIGWLGTQQ